MKKYFIVIIIILAACPAVAGKPEISDFGCQLEIQTSPESSISRLIVPEQVYMCVSRPDLGDLRVFGEDGILPHTIRRPVYGQGEAPAPRDLPFFPVYKDEEKGGGLYLHVQTGNGGSIVDLRTEADRERPDAPTFWLIDASSLGSSFTGLTIEWNGPKGLVFDIYVEAGNDLTKWRIVKGPVTLADLDYGGHSLSNHLIEIPITGAKYLRLSWPKEVAGARISSVKALFPKPGKAPEMKWKEIAGKRVGSVSGKAAYEFDTAGLFPIERLDMNLPAGTGLMQGVMMSRPDIASNWRIRHTGVFYGLVINGRMIRGGGAYIPYTSDRFWRFETSSETAPVNGSFPSLRIGWTPHELFFVSSGSKNCILAYGQTGLGLPLGNGVDSLMSSLSADKDFKPADAIISTEKNVGRKFNPPGQAVSFRKWLLWAVLLLGVAIVGVMAWKLYRQMGNDG